MTTTTHAPAGIDLDSPLIAALKSARELLANLDGLSKNNICNLAAEEVENIDIALAQQSSHSTAAVVAAGWKLVPLVCTPEMRAAWDRSPADEDGDIEFHNAYRAMIDAAPMCHAGLSQFANGEDAGQPAKATVIWPSEKFVHERIAKLMADIGMADDTPLWNAFSTFEADLRSRVEAVAPSDATGKAAAASAGGRGLEGALKMVKQSNVILASALASAQERIEKLTATSAADAKDAERLDYVYQISMVDPFIAPIATKEKWLASIDRGIDERAAIAASGKGGE
jgi:hypothetical protein